MELKNTHYVLIGIVSGLTCTIGFYFWDPNPAAMQKANPIAPKSVVINAKELENLTKTMEKEPYYSINTDMLSKYEEIGIVNYNKNDPTAGEKPKEEPGKQPDKPADKPNEKPNPDETKQPTSSIDSIVSKYATAYKVDEKWIKALIDVYDNKNKNVFKQQDGSVNAGVMMVNSETAQRIAAKYKLQYSQENLKNDDTNIQIGTLFLQEIAKKNGDIHYIFTTYRYGEQRAEELKRTQNTYASDFSQKVIAKLGGKS